MLRKKDETKGEQESKGERRLREAASEVWNEARVARERGLSFFAFAFPVASDSTALGVIKRDTYQSAATILGEVEKLGWRLEHVDHVHIPRSEINAMGIGGLGGTDNSGVMVGHHYFRGS